MTTKIEWTDATWNPVVGCRRVSAGCEHCYAEVMAYRLEKMGQERYRGLTVLGKAGRRWSWGIRLVPEVLDKPLRWRKPRMVFVNSMSDLWHEAVPFEYIAAVFGVMAAAPQHTFQVLTQRPERMLEWFEWAWSQNQRSREDIVCEAHALEALAAVGVDTQGGFANGADSWPLPNVWIGVSCENQETADARIPLLLQCPAAVRWVSAEPLLGPIDFDPPRCDSCEAHDIAPGSAAGEAAWCLECDSEASFGHWMGDVDCEINWVVVGGESGRGARDCDVAWVRYIVDQCRAADVPVFVKQLGAVSVAHMAASSAENGSWETPAIQRTHRFHHPKGGNPEEWPEHLRVRQWPEGVTSNG